jgi:hypothetical protein
VLSQSYDGLLYPEEAKVTTTNQQTPLVLENTWGKNQELKERTRIDVIGNDSATKSESYQYDDELRLTQVETDTLDAQTNRIQHSRIDGNWTYDANDRADAKGRRK